MTNYELTELVRYMAQALYAIERERTEEASDCIAPTPTFAGEFKYVVDRIDDAEKEDKAKRVDGTMADWFMTAEEAERTRMKAPPARNYDLTTILQLRSAELITRTEARELLGLPDDSTF